MYVLENFVFHIIPVTSANTLIITEQFSNKISLPNSSTLK